MSQKQAKRLRRMQEEIDLAHAATWKLINRLAVVEERLSAGKPTLWQRVWRAVGAARWREGWS